MCNRREICFEKTIVYNCLETMFCFFSVHSSKGSASRKNQVQSSGGLASNLFSVQSCGGLGLKQIEGAIVWMPCFERTAVCNRLEALS